MDKQDISRQAAAIGLELTPAQEDELARATALAVNLAAQVPRDLSPADEPALIFRLARRGRA